MNDILNIISKATGTPWLANRTIYLTKHGSQAYGTNMATSDLDIKGIAIPPREYVLGFNKKFEQAEFSKPDMVIFDIRKFIGLAADCNPNVIEIMYTDPFDHIYIKSPMDTLISNRDLFISKKAKFTFSGYAVSQLKRIQTHYRWLKNPPTKKPERGDFKLPDNKSLLPPSERDIIEAAIQKQIDSWQLDLSTVDNSLRLQIEQKLRDRLFFLEVSAGRKEPMWEAAAISLNLNEDVLWALAQERKYNAALKEWNQYQNWQINRNPDRAILEAKHGYDCKHAMHLVRLMRMCGEILSGQGVIVRRPDKDELLAIRNGAWTYEHLIEWADAQEKKLDGLYNTSSLPKIPDRDRIDKLCIQIIETQL
jgi:predicted nucleotidyltransferase